MEPAIIPPSSSIPVPRGEPAELLAAARDVLGARADALGLSIQISHDFAHLLAVNAAARTAGTWDTLIRTVDPRFRQLGVGNAFWLAAIDSTGDAVSVQAAALLDCTARSWGERFADLSLFYDDVRAAPADEWAQCESQAALAARGRLVWTLGGWTRPDYRGRGLLSLLHRLAKIEAWSRWRPDAFTGVVEWDVLRAWTPQKVGRRYLDPEPWLEWQMPENGLTRLHFMRFEPADFLDDVVRVASELGHAEAG